MVTGFICMRVYEFKPCCKICNAEKTTDGFFFGCKFGTGGHPKYGFVGNAAYGPNNSASYNLIHFLAPIKQCKRQVDSHRLHIADYGSRGEESTV